MENRTELNRSYAHTDIHSRRFPSDLQLIKFNAHFNTTKVSWRKATCIPWERTKAQITVHLTTRTWIDWSSYSSHSLVCLASVTYITHLLYSMGTENKCNIWHTPKYSILLHLLLSPHWLTSSISSRKVQVGWKERQIHHLLLLTENPLLSFFLFL